MEILDFWLDFLSLQKALFHCGISVCGCDYVTNTSTLLAAAKSMNELDTLDEI